MKEEDKKITELSETLYMKPTVIMESIERKYFNDLEWFIFSNIFDVIIKNGSVSLEAAFRIRKNIQCSGSRVYAISCDGQDFWSKYFQTRLYIYRGNDCNIKIAFPDDLWKVLMRDLIARTGDPAQITVLSGKVMYVNADTCNRMRRTGEAIIKEIITPYTEFRSISSIRRDIYIEEIDNTY